MSLSATLGGRRVRHPNQTTVNFTPSVSGMATGRRTEEQIGVRTKKVKLDELAAAREDAAIDNYWENLL